MTKLIYSWKTQNKQDMALKVCFPIQRLHTNDLPPRQFPILKHLWPSGSADTALCIQTRNKTISGNSPATKVFSSPAAKAFFCSFHKPEKQQHWELPPSAPNSHSWDPSRWSLSCSFSIPDLYQTGKRHSVLGQDLLICPCKDAKGQVCEVASYPNCANLPPAARSTGLRRPRVVVPSGFLLSNSHWNKIRYFNLHSTWNSWSLN